MLMATVATTATAQKMDIEHKGDTTIIRVDNPTKYILLPIQEEKDEAQVLLDTGSKDDTWMDVRLAQNGADYYVPFALGHGKTATVKILGLAKDALALNLMKQHLRDRQYRLLPSLLPLHSPLRMDERPQRHGL